MLSKFVCLAASRRWPQTPNQILCICSSTHAYSVICAKSFTRRPAHPWFFWSIIFFPVCLLDQLLRKLSESIEMMEIQGRCLLSTIGLYTQGVMKGATPFPPILLRSISKGLFLVFCCFGCIVLCFVLSVNGAVNILISHELCHLHR